MPSSKAGTSADAATPFSLPPDLADWPLHLIEQRFTAQHHGDYLRWMHALEQLPASPPCAWQAKSAVAITFASGAASHLQASLQQLHPWRKGPFQIGDIYIDTEWRSDWKWQRLAPHIRCQQAQVLDVGSGNGYFGWQMLAAGASAVIGIDPTLLFCMQHRAVQHFIQHPAHWVLPLGIEEIGAQPRFDVVLSMGVIYHRRDPQQHVEQLFNLLKPGGQLVLESIITEAEQGFVPEKRYARMRNVWNIPTVAELRAHLLRAGGEDVVCVDVSPTTVAEQRTTEWMRFESLAAALDPSNPALTIEGYPAPTRAILIANKPL
ncbi:MAG: tRNA 5-methoxyuridine(34)/uridine 5-oxyacetic acid(34) synthase CmoB [Pseudomonadota bacterium]